MLLLLFIVEKLHNIIYGLNLFYFCLGLFTHMDLTFQSCEPRQQIHHICNETSPSLKPSNK